MAEPRRLFCFGLGYTAQFLIRALREQGGWSFAGTTRDLQKSRELRSQGISTFLFDDENPMVDPRYALFGATHILVSTPPDGTGDPVLDHHELEFENLPALQWLGYFSTTGVYGNRDGNWVDEKTETRPSSIRGTRRLRAEHEWEELAKRYNLPLHIFRLAGIYGPGRSALDSVRAGIARRLLKHGHVFNRIHVEDIVQTVIASINQPNPGAIYNLADDEPCASHEVIAYASQLLDVPAPPLISIEEANLAPITQSFYSDNKRVSNKRIKTELGVTLRYPDFRAGLEGCQKWERANPGQAPLGSTESIG